MVGSTCFSLTNIYLCKVKGKGVFSILLILIHAKRCIALVAIDLGIRGTPAGTSLSMVSSSLPENATECGALPQTIVVGVVFHQDTLIIKRSIMWLNLCRKHKPGFNNLDKCFPLWRFSVCLRLKKRRAAKTARRLSHVRLSTEAHAVWN